MITVHPGEIPDEGLHLSGTLRKDIFQLDEGDEVRPVGPTTYHLHLIRSEDLVLAQGTVETPFQLRCVVCLEEFPFTSRIDRYLAEFEVDGGDLDLAERIREDLLLNLPAYPHCDRGDDPDRICPMAGRLGAAGEDAPTPGPSAWDALDGLDTAGKSGD